MKRSILVLASVLSFLVIQPKYAVAVCSTTATAHCLQESRFRVEVQWSGFGDDGGMAHTVPGATADSGLFYFFGPNNWEILVKVLNACGSGGGRNDRFWVFAASATTLKYEMTVTDTQTGARRTYVNALGVSSPATTDTEAFATCGGAVTPLAVAVNNSVSTLCAEEDNINIPIVGRLDTFEIEATHPSYSVGVDNCEPDSTNCSPSPDTCFPFTEATFALFDDGEVLIEAVRQECWWRPNGMSFSVNDGQQVNDIHYIRVSSRVAQTSEYPQFFILYMDGNVRLIPHPPFGRDRVCFGSSVLVGPVTLDVRPIAEISSARYISKSKTIEVTYRFGGRASFVLRRVDRAWALVEVAIHYPTQFDPFVSFQSMFVQNGNADVDRVRWIEPNGAIRESSVSDFLGSLGSDWLFFRTTRSQHNTSAPDISIQLVR